VWGAGVGAAWLWKGGDGETLTTDTINAMQRFMRASGGDMRVLGGARFDSNAAVSHEWAPFGSFYMVLPALELVRAARASCRAFLALHESVYCSVQCTSIALMSCSLHLCGSCGIFAVHVRACAHVVHVKESKQCMLTQCSYSQCAGVVAAVQ
jgi:hypothetical protein